MHHLNKFSNYTPKKKVGLIVALIAKFAVLAAIFAGLMFLLKDYVSSTVLFASMHVVLIIVLVAIFYVHKHKNQMAHAHDPECKCE